MGGKGEGGRGDGWKKVGGEEGGWVEEGEGGGEGGWMQEGGGVGWMEKNWMGREGWMGGRGWMIGLDGLVRGLMGWWMSWVVMEWWNYEELLNEWAGELNNEWINEWMD